MYLLCLNNIITRIIELLCLTSRFQLHHMYLFIRQNTLTNSAWVLIIPELYWAVIVAVNNLKDWEADSPKEQSARGPRHSSFYPSDSWYHALRCDLGSCSRQEIAEAIMIKHFERSVHSTVTKIYCKSFNMN